MDVEEEEKASPKDEPIHAPFPVATVKDAGLNLRAYLNTQGKPEWLWARVQEFLGIKSYGGSFLQSNKEPLQGDMEQLEVPKDQMHYKPKGYEGTESEPWKDHTLESRALLSLLVTCLKSKPLKPEQKDKAFRMFLLLATTSYAKAHSLGELPAFPHVAVTAPTGRLQMGYLTFNMQGLCESWGSLMHTMPAAESLWGKLTTKPWRGYQLSSSWAHPRMDDLLAFLLHLAASPKMRLGGQVLWETMGKGVLPSMMVFLAGCMDAFASSLTHLPLDELPVLKTKSGFARKSSDQTNKLLVLDRVKKERLHRWRIAKTHCNLISEHCKLMKAEAYLSTVLHDRISAEAFSGVLQLSVSWDPSNYGGSETLVGMVYSVEKNLASYLLVQPLRRLLVSDLDDALREDGRKGSLKRVEGYVEVRALSAALKNLGCSLQDFQVPSGLHWKPLSANELRIQQNGAWWIVNTVDNTATLQIPAGLDMGKIPALVSISDQGPSNLAALNFLQYSESALMLSCQYDPFHRAWNDIKLAARRGRSYPWKTMLELTLVYNLPYGPFGSGSWHSRKQDCLKDFLAENSAASGIFQDHLPLICRELGIQEPQNAAQQQDLFDSLANLRSFCEKGPLVKLMRWFSFFESAVFYSGELWCTRMILLSEGNRYEDEEEEQGPPVQPEAAARQDPREALNRLKKTKGTWKLAPQLISEHTVDQQRMLLQVCKATWKHHASRARDVKNPQQVLALNVAHVAEGRWVEELEDMVRYACWDRELLHQQFFEQPGEDRSVLLVDHASFFEELLAVRAASLATASLLPPMRYNGTLSSCPRTAAQAANKVQKEWGMLLEVEAAVADGGHVPFLGSLVWRKSPFVRCLFLAYEQGLPQGCSLQRQIAQTLGDSRVVENAHSKCKDVMREGRTNTVKTTTIQHQLLMSGALEERGVPMTKVTPADKVFAASSSFTTPVIRKMNPRSHRLPLSFQKMMVKQGVANSWPSPSPASLFPILAATEWLFEVWGTDLPGRSLHKAWMTVMAGQPGTILAQRSTARLFKVIQAAEYGMLVWSMKVQEGHGGTSVYTMEPNRVNLSFAHIHELDDWLVVPTKPQLLHPGTGPLGWIRVGEPEPIPASLCKKGVQITVKQIKQVLDDMKVAYASNLKRKDLQILLIKTCLVHLEEQDAAIAKLQGASGTPEPDLDDILTLLEEDDANYQEAKKLKKQNKKKTVRTKEEEVKKPKKSRRPKGKAKAGKGRGKGKARGSFASKVRKGILKKGSTKELNKEQGPAEIAPGAPGSLPGSPQPAEIAPDAPGSLPGSPQPSKFPEPASGSKGPEPSSGSKGPEPAPEAPGQDLQPRPSINFSKESQRAPAQRAADPEVPPRPREARIRSPEEILSQIAPPGATFGISHQDHRFTSRMGIESCLFEGKMKQKGFTASFAQRHSWQDALANIHEFNWRKWHMVKEELPLPEGMSAQTPGVVPKDVLDQLAPYIQRLPTLKRYGKK